MDYENSNDILNYCQTDNLKDACRTCLKLTNNFISVFSKSEKYEKTYAEIIMEIAPVVITLDQKYSRNVCTECVNLICTVYNFQQQCIQVDSLIRYGSNTENSSQFIKHEKSEFEIYDTNVSSNFDFPDNLADEKSDLKILKSNPILTETLDLHSGNKTNEKTTNREENKRKILIRKTKRPKLTDSGQSIDVATKRRLVKDAINEHSKEKTNHCDTCNKTFKARKNFLNHINNKHLGIKKSCDVCGKIFFYKNNLLRHKKMHNGLAYVCEFCGKKFTQKYKLTQHIFTHTNSEKTEKTHQCDQCSKLFISPYRLQVHTHNCHSSNRKRICELCNRIFSSNSALNQHKASTHIVAESLCECGKQFKNPFALKMHKKNVHSNQRPYQCTVCGDRFAYISAFNSHMLLHKGEKPFKCKFCPKTFRQSPHVKTHERIHTGEKPYSCEQCLKSFRHQTTFNHHMRIHTGEKPYQCKICDRSFNHLTNMKKHFLGHQ